MSATTVSRSDVTTIWANVSGAPEMQSKRWSADPGHTFLPQKVCLTITRITPAQRWDKPVLVKVSGPKILKGGNPGQQTLEHSFCSVTGIYTSEDPLDQMPQWLADWVQQAPDEVLGDAE